MSDDPVDEMDEYETQTLEASGDMYWFDLDGGTHFSGRDRVHEDIRVTDAYVEGSDVVVEVAADVTKVDPETKPVFQTEDRFENGYNHSRRPWYQPYANIAVGTLIAGIVTVGVGTEVLETVVPDMDIHPLLLAVSELAPLAMVVAILAAVVGLLTVGPRGSFE